MNSYNGKNATNALIALQTSLLLLRIASPPTQRPNATLTCTCTPMRPQFNRAGDHRCVTDLQINSQEQFPINICDPKQLFVTIYYTRLLFMVTFFYLIIIFILYLIFL